MDLEKNAFSKKGGENLLLEENFQGFQSVVFPFVINRRGPTLLYQLTDKILTNLVLKTPL